MANTTKVDLNGGAKIGGKSVDSLTVAEPMAGQMRGLLLTDILQMKVDALIVLLPRICTPIVTEAEVASMPPRHLMALGVAVVGFFAPPGQRLPEATTH